MAIIDQQVEHIRDSVLHMMALTRKQVARSQEALFGFNKDITEEIIMTEKVINALDLKIDKDCEQTLALYHPVADDLRLIVAVLSINTYLERIGDNADSIAKFINDFEQPIDSKVLDRLRLKEIFEHCLFMFDIVVDSFSDEDTQKAVKVFKTDKLIDEMAKDVQRLRIITERFSKIGSAPDLLMVSLYETLLQAVSYMNKRRSQEVEINTLFNDDAKNVFVALNIPLFEWVIENLCKNAIDAMDGFGKIDIVVSNEEANVIIDLIDNA